MIKETVQFLNVNIQKCESVLTAKLSSKKNTLTKWIKLRKRYSKYSSLTRTGMLPVLLGCQLESLVRH